MTGTVVDWFPDSAYGRILGADGRRFFVHRSALGGVQGLALGQAVEFVSTVTGRGPRAESVRLIATPTPAMTE